MLDKIFTVSALNDLIKELLEGFVERLWVEGEVSNVARPASGHIYFTLKDEASQIRAVIFRRAGKMGDFAAVVEGAHLLCRVRLGVYKPRGEYHLIVETVERRGIGILQRLFEETKARLSKEGLFEERHKKSLPFLPKHVAVVTSPSGAVIRDILTISARRFPTIPITIVPTRVQGSDVAVEITTALQRASELAKVEVIIIARGGGSLEDLAAFNDEQLARAIFRCPIPVVSAIGHETDYTIADFVADKRAPTPSAAAQLVFPDRDLLLGIVRDFSERLSQAQSNALITAKQRLEELQERLKVPERQLDEMRMRLDEQWARAQRSIAAILMSRKERQQNIATHLFNLNPRQKLLLNRLLLQGLNKSLATAWDLTYARRWGIYDTLVKRLSGVNPLDVLKRGYGIISRAADGLLVTSAASVAKGESIKIRLAHGSLSACVEETYEE